MKGAWRAGARWVHHRPVLVIALLLLGAFAAWGFFLYSEIQENQYRSCLRGNEIRSYLIADNNQRIERIATGLADPETPGKRELRDELRTRRMHAAVLRQVNCEDLH